MNRNRIGVNTSPYWMIVLALLFVGCELGPPVDDPAAVVQSGDSLDNATAQCKSDAPVCVEGCGLNPTDIAAHCKDGRWVCDGGVPADNCGVFAGACDPLGGCGYGYSCVKSMSHPIPSYSGICRKGIVPRNEAMETCSQAGTLSATEFLQAKTELTGQIVKFTGVVDVDFKCSQNGCAMDQCCNTCVGNFVVDMQDPVDPNISTAVTIRTETLACKGTNCEIACGPLTVGETYLFWGFLDSCLGQSNCTLLYMGSCLY